jgi:hypothetical protein
MLKVNLIQRRRTCCGGGGHHADVGALTLGAFMLWAIALCPGLVLWAIPLAIVSAALTLALVPVGLAFEALTQIAPEPGRIDAGDPGQRGSRARGLDLRLEHVDRARRPPLGRDEHRPAPHRQAERE